MLHIAQYRTEVDETVVMAWFTILRDRETKRERKQQANYFYWQGPFIREKTGMNMWRKNCPVCQQQLEKKHPAETVTCTCGRYVWKG
jgi:hypothetical protein